VLAILAVRGFLKLEIRVNSSVLLCLLYLLFGDF